MTLIDQWKLDPSAFKGKNIQQILSWCGDGLLKDGSATSHEFRDFLAHIPSDALARYAVQCLELKFADSGFALQDLVNQIGKRLGFQIDYGRYRGVQKDIGFDGLWRANDGTTILVEVKTTDVYRLSLDVTATYRKKLLEKERIAEAKSSILYVVGRYDTGELEAQVRGSRHAWDIRLVSVDSLLNLLRIKEELQDQQTIDKIRDVLTPKEYTRVDGIVDLVFTATKETKVEDESEPEETEEEKGGEKKFTPVNFRKDCVERLNHHFNDSLIKQTAAIYATPDDQRAVWIGNSRSHDAKNSRGYWFAFHPPQKQLLEQYPEAWACFGCGSADNLILVPLAKLSSWLGMFNQTLLPDRSYWHIRIKCEGGIWTILTRTGFEVIDAGPYLLKSSSP